MAMVKTFNGQPEQAIRQPIA